MSTEHQINELLPFLVHPTPQLANLALVNLLPYTVQSSPYRSLFLTAKSGPDGSERGYIRILAGLCRAADDEVTRKCALTALVNLSDSVTTCSQIAKLEGFVDWLLDQILDVSSPLADVASMLLANLTKLDAVCQCCLRITDSANKESRLSGIQSLEKLVGVFAREGSNKNANYDYLAHAFANISAVNIEEGRQSLLGMPASLASGSESVIPLADLVQFTEHPSSIRRVGIASTLKNCAFVQEAHPLLLSSGAVNFLPYILLPLCGPEEFDLEEQDKMPSEVQLLGPDKKREQEPTTRLMLVETLILLCASRNGREVLRERGVYEVVKVAHKAERDEDTRIAMERLVNLLMREESSDTKIEELSSTVMPKDDEDDSLVEV